MSNWRRNGKWGRERGKKENEEENEAEGENAYKIEDNNIIQKNENENENEDENKEDKEVGENEQK